MMIKNRNTSTCELFWQVLARIANATRPTIHLCEIVNDQQLERLLLLLVGTDFNRGDISWGGAWAQYSLTCMIQDILAGMKQEQKILILFLPQK